MGWLALSFHDFSISLFQSQPGTHDNRITLTSEEVKFLDSMWLGGFTVGLNDG